MKQAFVVILSLCLLAGCVNRENQDLTEARGELANKIFKIVKDTTLSPEVSYEKFVTLLMETYEQHKNDSLGLEIFPRLINNVCTPKEAIALYDDASRLVRNNEEVKSRIKAIKAEVEK